MRILPRVNEDIPYENSLHTNKPLFTSEDIYHLCTWQLIVIFAYIYFSGSNELVFVNFYADW